MPDEVTPAEALDLRESSVTLLEGGAQRSLTKPDGTTIELGFDHAGQPKDDGMFDADGRVPMHIIRPGLGRGKGRHLYEARMLESNAGKFAGWKQYVNHLSPEAKKAAGGLPRDVRDLGGRIVESWWDGNVPANDRFGTGAVVALAKPTPFMGELIDHDPEIVEASISATATAVRPGHHDGQRCWIVEGIEDRGSVDWVTEAGAGGRVVSIMEAAFEHDSEGRMALLASMSDDEFTAYLAAERPGLIEAVKGKNDGDAEDAKDGGVDDVAEKVAELMKKGMPRAMAERAAKKSMQESEEDEMPITPEALAEALSSEDNRAALLEALNIDQLIESRVDARAKALVEEMLPDALEEALDTEREIIRATAKADADRRVQIVRFRETAHGLIEAARLPEAFKTDIKARFDIDEAGNPTSPLNVIDSVDDDGEVEKPAADKLREAVEAEIERAAQLAAAANPTRVRNQGPSAGGDDGEAVARKPVPEGGLLESLLQESGFDDPSKVYDEPKALQG